MKNILILILAIVTINCSGYRVGKGCVKVGDSIEMVLQACGSPEGWITKENRAIFYWDRFPFSRSIICFKDRQVTQYVSSIDVIFTNFCAESK